MGNVVTLQFKNLCTPKSFRSKGAIFWITFKFRMLRRYRKIKANELEKVE